MNRKTSSLIIICFFFINSGFSNNKIFDKSSENFFNLRVSNSECGKITIAWDLFPSSLNITSIEIKRAEHITLGYPVSYNVAATEISYIDLNIQANKNYYYKIIAKSGTEAIESYEIVTGIANCPEPPILHVTKSTCGEVGLKWDDFPDNISHNGFKIYRSEPGLSSGSEIADLNSSTFTYIDNNISNYNGNPNHIYNYRIKGKFNNGYSQESQAIQTQFSCSKPQGLTVEKYNCGLSLTWLDYMAPITENGFVIYRSENRGYNYQAIATIGPNQINYIDNINIQAGVTYYYKIAGLFNQTVSDFTNPVEGIFFTCQETPISDAPTGLRVENSNCGKFKVIWDAYPAGSQVTSYVLSYMDTQGQFIERTTISNANSIVISNIIPNKNYYFKIKGKFGTVLTSESEEVVSIATPCPSPSGLTIKSTGCGEVELEWDTYTNSENLIGYKIYKSSQLISYFYDIGIVNSNTFVDNSTFEANTTYYYKILAVFSNNSDHYYSDYSEIKQATSNCPTLSRPIITQNQCTNVVLNWNDFPANITEKSFQVYSSRSPTTNFQYLGNVGSNTFTFIDKSLKIPGATYYYKISGYVNYSFTPLSEVSSPIISQCQNYPLNLTLGVVNCNGITLNWNDFPDGINEEGFEIMWSSTNGNFSTQIATVGKNITTFTHAIYYTPYTNIGYYAIRGKFSGQTETALSNSVYVNFSCSPPAPTNLTFIESECGKIKLTWDDYSDIYTEQGYEIYRKAPSSTTFAYVGSTTSNVLTFEDTQFGMLPDLIYTYKIRGKFNGSFNSDYSNSVTASFTNCAIPSGLRLKSAVCGKIQIEWDDYDESIQERGFVIYRSTGIDGNYSKIGEVGQNVLSYIDADYIFEKTSYFYKIAGKIFGANSDLTSSISAYYICESPSNLRLVSGDCNGIKIAWDPYPTEIIPTQYNIYRSVSGQNNFELKGIVGSNEFEFTDKFILQAITYDYKVAGFFYPQATNHSNIVSASFQCSPPTNLQVLDVKCGKIKLKWDGYSPETKNTGYRIYRTENGENGNYTQVGYVHEYSTEFEDNNLSNTTTQFYYRVAGNYDGVISQFSNGAFANYNINCGMPQNLIATNINCGAIRLQWDDMPAAFNETNYDIYVGYSLNGEFYKIGTSNQNETFYDFFNNSIGTTYYFKIKGKINSFESPFSNVIQKINLCDKSIFTTIKSGFWNSSNTWLDNKIPLITSDATISTGHQVFIPKNYEAELKSLINNGFLILDSNSKVKLTN